MEESVSTGGAAKILGTTEPYLDSLVRRQKIPTPKTLFGRRWWSEADVENARPFVVEMKRKKMKKRAR